MTHYEVEAIVPGAAIYDSKSERRMRIVDVLDERTYGHTTRVSVSVRSDQARKNKAKMRGHAYRPSFEYRTITIEATGYDDDRYVLCD